MMLSNKLMNKQNRRKTYVNSRRFLKKIPTSRVVVRFALRNSMSAQLYTCPVMRNIYSIRIALKSGSYTRLSVRYVERKSAPRDRNENEA